MCERGPVLDRLKAAEKAGSIVVNSADAIRNTYRHRMVELFARHNVSAPLSHIVATDASKLRPAAGVWVKRYDFHATQPDDVIYTASEDGWHEALRRFARRGIPFVIGQEHVAGDLVKFYGVRNGALPMDENWFEWFYHRDKGMMGHSFQAARLRQASFHAAAALGLEIFGGDAIIKAGRRTDHHRPQRLAELREISRSGCGSDRRLPDRTIPATPARRFSNVRVDR